MSTRIWTNGHAQILRDSRHGIVPPGSPEAKAAIERVQAQNGKWTGQSNMPWSTKPPKPLTKRCAICDAPIARNRKRCQPCAAQHERDTKNANRRKANDQTGS